MRLEFAKPVALLMACAFSLGAGSISFAQALPPRAVEPVNLPDCVFENLVATAEKPSPGGVARCAASVPVGKFAIIEFPEPISEIRVGGAEKQIDATAQSLRRMIVYGKGYGTAQVMVLGADKQTIALVDISVTPDLVDLRKKIFLLLPEIWKYQDKLRIEFVEGKIAIWGLVDSDGQKDTILRLISGYVESDKEKEERKGLRDNKNANASQPGGNQSTNVNVSSPDGKQEQPANFYDTSLILDYLEVKNKVGLQVSKAAGVTVRRAQSGTAGFQSNTYLCGTDVCNVRPRLR